MSYLTMAASPYRFTFAFPGPNPGDVKWAREEANEIDNWTPETEAREGKKYLEGIHDYLDRDFHLPGPLNTDIISDFEDAINGLAWIRVKKSVQEVDANTALDALRILCRPSRKYQLDHCTASAWKTIISESAAITLEDKAHLAAHMLVENESVWDPYLHDIATTEDKIAYCLQRYELDLQHRHHDRIDTQIFDPWAFDDLPADETDVLLVRAIRTSGWIRYTLHHRIMSSIWDVTRDLNVSSPTLRNPDLMPLLLPRSNVSLEDWVKFCFSCRRLVQASAHAQDQAQNQSQTPSQKPSPMDVSSV